jgi:5-methylcytosine-specific restriction protein A
MATYLLTWNPDRWPWIDLQECIDDIKTQGYHLDTWSCGVTKRIIPDDRVFLIKLGKEPRGIVASGWATSEVYEDTHWNKAAKAKGKKSLHIDVHFDTILDSGKIIFPRSKLDKGILVHMHWDAQASGSTISTEVAVELEMQWAKFLNQPITLGAGILPEEAEISNTFDEGAKHQIIVNAYERSSEARSICIKHYGLNCSVCGFNFEKVYGELGSKYIHVHHLKPLSEIGENYRLNPIKDLRPICPNCHAMIHKRKPAYTIEELKRAMKQASY